VQSRDPKTANLRNFASIDGATSYMQTLARPDSRLWLKNDFNGIRARRTNAP
jgi:hypothetical protein